MKITVADALREGNWSAASWSPRVTDEAAFQAFIGGLAARAAAYVEWRVGAARYADAAQPQAAVLAEAEMHLCQEQILLSAAAAADSARDPGSPPFLATGAELRAHAEARRARAEGILRVLDQWPAAPAAARTGEGAPPLADYRFDEARGRVRRRT